MRDDQQLHSVVFFLSDHICSAIEAGEELLKLNYASPDYSEELSSEDILNRLDLFHSFLDRLRHFEFLLVTKLNQVRQWGLHLRDLDPEFQPLIDLFMAATQILSDADLMFQADRHPQDIFNGRNRPDERLEARQIRNSSTHNEEKRPANNYKIDENYLIAGKVRLVDLLEVCHCFLDGLETRFDISKDQEKIFPLFETKSDTS